MHRHGRSTKEVDSHGGTTSIPVPTGGTVDRFRTGDRATISPESFQLLRDDGRNQPQVKRGKDDGAI